MRQTKVDLPNPKPKGAVKSALISALVQVTGIFTKIIVNKIIAVECGPSGLGIYSFYSGIINTIKSSASLGVPQSVVRDVAKLDDCCGSSQENVLKSARYLIYGCAVFGMVMTLGGALAYNSIADQKAGRTTDWFLISIAVGIMIIAEGKIGVLKGLRQITVVGKINLVASFLTIISVWILISVSGCAEIVGVLVLQPLVLLLVLQRMMRYPIKLTWSINLFELLRVSKKILFTGICLSAVNLIGNVASLVISIHIKRVGGEYVLGLFNAGQTIVVGCFSAIISAVTMDYYPTVASFRDDNARIGVALNNQTIIALRMINPALVCTVLYAPFLVRLLYSKDFLPAAQVVKYGVFGVAITVFSNQLDLILVAKGQNRSFFVIAIFYRISEIVICVFLFSVAGLTGLGIGMILTALMHLCLMYAFVVKVYKISYTKQVYRNMLITLLFVALSLIVVNSASGDFAIASGVLVVATSVLYSVRSLWSMLMAER